MIVQDIMTTNIKTVSPDQPVKDILQHMFPDLEEAISDTNFDFENMETNYKGTMNVKISEIMTKGVAVLMQICLV